MGLYPTLVNGQAYDYVSIEVLIAGVPMPSVKSINYQVNQEKTNNYGTNAKPVSRGRGAKEFTASLDISMNDVEALRSAAPNGQLVDIPPFDIIVAFGNIQNPVVHRLKMCEFVNDGVEGSQGDTDLTRTFDLMPADILFR